MTHFFLDRGSNYYIFSFLLVSSNEENRTFIKKQKPKYLYLFPAHCVSSHTPEGSDDAELRLVQANFVVRAVCHDPVVTWKGRQTAARGAGALKNTRQEQMQPEVSELPQFGVGRRLKKTHVDSSDGDLTEAVQFEPHFLHRFPELGVVLRILTVHV